MLIYTNGWLSSNGAYDKTPRPVVFDTKDVLCIQQLFERKPTSMVMLRHNVRKEDGHEEPFYIVVPDLSPKELYEMMR